MIVRFALSLPMLFAVVLIPAANVHALQSANNVNVIAGGLVNPRDVLVTPDGRIVVTQAGSAGDLAGESSLEPPVGPITGGATGSIVNLVSGCPAPYIDGLPSARNATGETFGPVATVETDGRVLTLLSGGGAENGNPEFASGVYDITTGVPELVADLGGWFVANARSTSDPVIDGGQWTDMIVGPDGGAVLVTEWSAGLVLSIGLDGTIAELVSTGNSGRPISLARGADGSILIALTGTDPYVAASGSVVSLEVDGSLVPLWTGLTLPAGLTVDSDGNLFVTQSSDLRENPPFLVPGTGSILRQTGPDSSLPVITGLNFPGPLAVAGDGSLLVALPTTGSDTGTGLLLSIDPSVSDSVDALTLNLAPPSCLGSTENVTIVVDDLGFNPSSISVAPGTTVTWRFGGAFDHAVVSEPSSPVSFDSGVLVPGSEFSVTFLAVGTFTYFDGLFPEHTAEIIVVNP